VAEPEIRVVGEHVCETDYEPLDIRIDLMNFPATISVPHEDNDALMVENLVTLHQNPDEPGQWVKRATAIGVRMRNPHDGALHNVSLTFTLRNQIHAESTALRK
jgi:hypothetical protein